MSKYHAHGEFECPWDGCDYTSPSRQGLGKHFKPTHGEKLIEYERRNREGDHECPTCGDVFETENGLKVHHKRAHDETIGGVEVECEYCGETKTVVPDRVDRYDSHYCDNTCRSLDERKRVETECDWCGDTFEIVEWYLEQSEKVFCPDKRCRKEWMSDVKSGEGNPNYSGGVFPYGPGWNEAKKRKVRIRDQARCQECGRAEPEHLDEFGEKHTVHHIQKARHVDDPSERNGMENLVTLCRGECHNKWERMAPLRPQPAD